MNALVQLLHTVTRHLRDHDIPYAVVGGIAVAMWGRPRATEDIDLLARIEERHLDDLAAYADEHGIRMDLAAARAAVRNGGSFGLYDTWSIHWVDVRIPTHDTEHAAMDGSTAIIVSEEKVHIAAPEDTILMKLERGREQDLMDARSIVLRKRAQLDLQDLGQRVHALKLDAPWSRVVDGIAAS